MEKKKQKKTNKNKKKIGVVFNQFLQKHTTYQGLLFVCQMKNC